MPSADLVHPDRNCLWGARRKARRRSRSSLLPLHCFNRKSGSYISARCS